MLRRFLHPSVVFLLVLPLASCKERVNESTTAALEDPAAGPADSKLIVITDMEPDDRMALQLLAANVAPSQIAFMGTTVMHAARKKALLCRLNQQIGYGRIDVYQGEGRDPTTDYKSHTVIDAQGRQVPVGVVEIAPVKTADFMIPKVVRRNPNGHDQEVGALSAARTYTDEGHILGEALRQRVTGMKRASSDLTNQLTTYLSDPANPPATILLLAAPTELEEALAAHPELAAKIKRVYLQGGWVTLAPKPQDPKQQPAPKLPSSLTLPPQSEPLCDADTLDEQGSDDTFVRRGYLCLTTYNWDLDIGASERFMSRRDIPMTLFSSHVVKDVFPGGSINPASGKAIWDVLLRPDVANLPSIKETRAEINSWDEHVMALIPALKPVIAPFKDSQFTPADPSLVVGMLAGDGFAPNAARLSVDVDIDSRVIVVSTGYAVTYHADPSSKIELLTKLDPKVFVDTFAAGMANLPAAIERNRRETGESAAATCADVLGDSGPN